MHTREKLLIYSIEIAENRNPPLPTSKKKTKNLKHATENCSNPIKYYDHNLDEFNLNFGIHLVYFICFHFLFIFDACLVMDYVRTAITQSTIIGSAQECKHQFKNRRWNCSTVDDNTVFGPVSGLGMSFCSICFHSFAAYLNSFRTFFIVSNGPIFFRLLIIITTLFPCSVWRIQSIISMWSTVGWDSNNFCIDFVGTSGFKINLRTNCHRMPSNLQTTVP